MTLRPDIDINGINEALALKADTDFGNIPNNVKYIVETWQSGTSWYRVWSDGWIEQGGYLSWNGAWTTLTFNRPFTTTNYYINGGGYRSDSSPYQCMIDFKDWEHLLVQFGHQMIILPILV